mmetsp:Transcript_45920/g.92618  ORF Transcript_45920/g.92618 Transcript_45920/m.92618 type:complete len:351 (-) Transcript_45920:525-1577(-)
MLDLHATTAVEVERVAIGSEPSRVPEAGGRLDAQLILEGPERSLRGGRQPHLRASGPDEAILHNHACDGDHGQASVVELCVQGAFATSSIADCARPSSDEEPRDSQLAASGGVSRDAVCLLPEGKQLQEGDEDADLAPALGRDLGECRNAIGDVCELEVQGRRAITRPTEVLGGNVAHARYHSNTSVLDLRNAPSSEGFRVTIRGKAQGIPVLERERGTKLTIESTKCRGILSRGRQPHLRASGADESVLNYHARDGDHRQPAVVDLCVQGALTAGGIANCARPARHEEPRDAELAATWGVAGDPVRLLPEREKLQEGDEDADLAPALGRNLGERRDAVGDVRELEVQRR